MHAVKGNLANTVCKRKHQHIASVPVLGGPCMLFSNFYSFLWGQGVEVMDIFFFLPLPSVTLTQSQGEVASLTGTCAFWPTKTKPNHVPDNGGLAVGQMCTHTFSCTVIYSTRHPDSFCEKTGPQIFQWIWSFSILAQAHTHTHRQPNTHVMYRSTYRGVGVGRQGHLEANLVSKHPLFMCRQRACAALRKAAAVAAAEGLMFATHVNIWQSITFPSNNILLLRPLKWGR